MRVARPPAPPLRTPPGVPLRARLHPGRFLDKYYLAPLRLTQSEAARRLGISRRRLHEIVQGRRGVSADTAIRFALAFGSSAAFWLALQAEHDSYLAWRTRPSAAAPSPAAR